MNNDVGSKAEGFVIPPDRVTKPCLTYMARIIELRKFIGFYFSFVKTSADIGKLISDDNSSQVSKQKYEVLKYNYSEQRPLVNQIMLSRAVETFDLYLTTILRDIFLSRPEMLKSETTIDVATILDAGNYDEVILRVVERKVHELSYKPLSELRKFITDRTGIDLFPTQEAFDRTILASEIRNLIAHNDCMINELFRKRTKGITETYEVSSIGRIKIDDEWLRKTSYSLDDIVFSFDKSAVKKFKLQSQDRMSVSLDRE